MQACIWDDAETTAPAPLPVPLPLLIQAMRWQHPSKEGTRLSVTLDSCAEDIVGDSGSNAIVAHTMRTICELSHSTGFF
jgi:hypothetical protein